MSWNKDDKQGFFVTTISPEQSAMLQIQPRNYREQRALAKSRAKVSCKESRKEF